jgi:hypothetical protein
MGLIRSIEPVTPIVALLYGNESHYEALRSRLSELFGPLELESPVYPFTFTSYYEDTMGPGLKRRFLVFEWESNPETLADWKRSTNDLEERFIEERGDGPQRPVNIDPGYITGGKLILASTKDFAHRIYLRDGIFAEVTMHFQDGEWRSHNFTFPDFKSGVYNDFLKQAREAHLRKAHTKGQPADDGEMTMEV